MTEWKAVTGSQEERPQEVDRTSSPTTVYLRRNIRQVEKATEGEPREQPEKEWQYEEQEVSVTEYEQMQFMQQIVEKKTEEIVESVTQFQKEAVIDEYTMQLIEEGLI